MNESTSMDWGMIAVPLWFLAKTVILIIPVKSRRIAVAERTLNVIGGLFIWFVLVSTVVTYVLPVLRHLISSEWTMPPALLAALIFYRIRGTRPFVYGVVEIFIGMTATWSGIHADATSYIAQGVAFFGGLYIIVRGLDNMDTALPPNMRPGWDKWFPKAKTNEAAVGSRS